jgi:hypothetical protein
LPENAFVVAARDSIPASRARVTTATTRGNLRGRGRGRGRSNAPREVEKDNTSFGRGKGKKRRTNTQVTESETRATTHSGIPDLNEQIVDQDVQEVPLSQSAPAIEDIQ